MSFCSGDTYYSLLTLMEKIIVLLVQALIMYISGLVAFRFV